MKYETYVYQDDTKTVKLEFSLPKGELQKKEAFLALLIQATDDLKKEIG